MQTRRQALTHSARVASLLVATGLFPQFARAFNQDAFAAKNLADAFRALGMNAPVASKDVGLDGPDMAENGASVLVTASTTLPGVKQVLLLVEKNPSSLIARFHLSDSVEANFAIRTKMGQSSDVYAVAVMADGKAFFAKKYITVIEGGCGG